MSFRTFLKESEDYDEDVKKTLAKLPDSHRKLVSQYKISFQPGNTLKGDNEHIGELDDVKKRIIVAAPWRYAREMTLLHEVAHIVYSALLSKKQKTAWAKLCKNTKMNKDARQEPEELFCQAYGATYSKHPPTTYYKPAWTKFIKSL